MVSVSEILNLPSRIKNMYTDVNILTEVVGRDSEMQLRMSIH